jgi:hypothetical protein
MALNDAVPSSATDVLKRNSEDIDRLVNGPSDVTSRTGKILPSWDEIVQSHAAWNDRGDWAAATYYAVKDIWRDAGTNNWYVTLTAFTSAATVGVDTAGTNAIVLQYNTGTASGQVPLNSDLQRPAKYQLEFDGVSSAVSVVSVSSDYPANSEIRTLSYKTASECSALSVPYPDGGGADYILKTSAQATSDSDVIDGNVNHALTSGGVIIYQKDDGVVIASCCGFDATGLTGNGALLNNLFSVYVEGFYLKLDVINGIYKWGDVPVEDNGVTYTVQGLGVGESSQKTGATTPTRCTYSANNDDVVRIQANDVRWIDITWDGADIDEDLYTPSAYVLGYNLQATSNTNDARNFNLTANLWDTPGKVIDWCQGVHPILQVRGARGNKPLLYARGVGVAAPYTGGIDNQNGVFDVHLSEWEDWTFYSEDDSYCGAHEFLFWKQYSCVNGIRLVKGLNHGRIYSERTRDDHSGIPYENLESTDYIWFLGASDDSRWYLRQNTEDTDNGVYVGTEDGIGIIHGKLVSKQFEVAHKDYAGRLKIRRTANNNTSIAETNTGNDSFLNVQHDVVSKQLYTKLDRLRMTDSGNSGALRKITQAYSTVTQSALPSGSVENYVVSAVGLTNSTVASVTFTSGLPDGVLHTVNVQADEIHICLLNMSGSALTPADVTIHYVAWEVEST